MSDLRSRDLTIFNRLDPSTPGEKVDLDDALACIENKVLHGLTLLRFQSG